jgi:hypothetical protein
MYDFDIPELNNNIINMLFLVNQVKWTNDEIHNRNNIVRIRQRFLEVLCAFVNSIWLHMEFDKSINIKEFSKSRNELELIWS